MSEPPDNTTVDAWSREALLRDEATELAKRFPGVVAWYGAATHEWWAIANGRLVEARGLYDLARLIADTCPNAPEMPVETPSRSVVAAPLPIETMWRQSSTWSPPASGEDRPRRTRRGHGRHERRR